MVSGRHPVLIDHFLEDAVEFDVDAVCDGSEVLIGGIMQHIEEAGIHSGDSFAVLPPWKTSAARAGGDARRHPAHRPRAGRGRPREHPVRQLRGRGARAGDQPPRLAHRALPREGHRPGPGAHRHPLHAGHRPGRPGRGRARRPQAHLRQGAGVPLPALPPHRPPAGPGDEEHRRGDGHRPRLRRGLRPRPAGHRPGPAHRGHRVRLGQRPRQGRVPAHRPRPARPGLRGDRHRGHAPSS